jgi:hypothetical protein
VNGVCVLLNGRLAAGYQTIEIWNLETGVREGVLEGHTDVSYPLIIAFYLRYLSRNYGVFSCFRYR